MQGVLTHAAGSFSRPCRMVSVRCSTPVSAFMSPSERLNRTQRSRFSLICRLYLQHRQKKRANMKKWFQGCGLCVCVIVSMCERARAYSRHSSPRRRRPPLAAISFSFSASSDLSLSRSSACMVLGLGFRVWSLGLGFGFLVKALTCEHGFAIHELGFLLEHVGCLLLVPAKRGQRRVVCRERYIQAA
jgi:hypothetical protein